MIGSLVEEITASERATGDFLDMAVVAVSSSRQLAENDGPDRAQSYTVVNCLKR